jgi:hypothetical protein
MDSLLYIVWRLPPTLSRRPPLKLYYQVTHLDRFFINPQWPIGQIAYVVHRLMKITFSLMTQA